MNTILVILQTITWPGAFVIVGVAWALAWLIAK
jgi:hypothetical protein